MFPEFKRERTSDSITALTQHIEKRMLIQIFFKIFRPVSFLKNTKLQSTNEGEKEGFVRDSRLYLRNAGESVRLGLSMTQLCFRLTPSPRDTDSKLSPT